MPTDAGGAGRTLGGSDNRELSTMMVRDHGNVSLVLSDLDVVRQFTTAHHRVVIYRHAELGRVLVLNDEIQHVEAWAPLYHEPLVHLPAACIRSVRRALLIGGGSFFAARELLRYRSMERVLMLDKDQELLAEIATLYEHAAIAREDPRLEVRSQDAFRNLGRMTERFDLVINDSIDLWSLPDRIFGVLASLLEPNGVCGDVVYRHIFDDRGLSGAIRLLRSKFSTSLSLVIAPEYPGVLQVLTTWSECRVVQQTRRRPVNREQLAWAKIPSSNPCAYYDPRFLPYYLYLPRYFRERLQEVTGMRV